MAGVLARERLSPAVAELPPHAEEIRFTAPGWNSAAGAPVLLYDTRFPEHVVRTEWPGLGRVAPAGLMPGSSALRNLSLVYEVSKIDATAVAAGGARAG